MRDETSHAIASAALPWIGVLLGVASALLPYGPWNLLKSVAVDELTFVIYGIWFAVSALVNISRVVSQMRDWAPPTDSMERSLTLLWWQGCINATMLLTIAVVQPAMLYSSFGTISSEDWIDVVLVVLWMPWAVTSILEARSRVPLGTHRSCASAALLATAGVCAFGMVHMESKAEFEAYSVLVCICVGAGLSCAAAARKPRQPSLWILSTALVLLLGLFYMWMGVALYGNGPIKVYTIKKGVVFSAALRLGLGVGLVYVLGAIGTVALHTHGGGRRETLLPISPVTSPGRDTDQQPGFPASGLASPWAEPTSPRVPDNRCRIHI